LDISKTYIIPFSKLEEGKHLFDFKAGNEFFENFDFQNIKGGELKIDVCLEKLSSRMILEFKIEGSIITICDLCLDEIEIPMKITDKLFVKFSGLGMEQIDENIIIGIEETELNIAHNIYEIVELNLPYKRTHPLDNEGVMKCNTSMLDKIDRLSGTNEKQDLSDPRWNKLKDLKL